MASQAYLQDVEAGLGLLDNKQDLSYAFAEQQVRLGFIRKVFGLLTVQLAVTAAVTAGFVLSPGVKSYVFSNPWTFWVSFAASLAIVLALSCSEGLRRRHPTNLLLLAAFTAAESVLVGTISAMYDTQVVLLAALMTVGITASLALYALQTKRDFTAAGGVLFSLLFALIGAGLLSVFFHSRGLNIAIAGIGAAVFGAYIVCDVQMMMGGRGMAIEPDEYVLAAINIYLDVVNLALYLMRLLQEIQSNN